MSTDKPVTARRKVEKAIADLNNAIVAALKLGHYPEIEILGEADDWPEFEVRTWSKFPKGDL